MRVLQLIDSLRPGGAEKMAVNIANALLPHVEGSYLCCTRQEGMLKDEIKPGVGYLYLNKKSRLDPKAILGLRKYINENKIDIVHVHSTSFFLAVLLKLSGSNFRLLWHDHYGDSENLEERDYKVLKIFSRFFAGIISVNTDLKNWAENNLNCKNVTEIRNFISEKDFDGKTPIRLKGKEDDFKIICVANLRPQKDHLNLLKAFEMLTQEHEVSLHLIGENPETEYSALLLKEIEKSPATEKIFYYGPQLNIKSYLEQANMGVLSSRSEGLPVTLLEYGLAGLPVVCPEVGKCYEVLGNKGWIVKKENPEELRKAFMDILNDFENAKIKGILFQLEVREKFLIDQNIHYFTEFYKF